MLRQAVVCGMYVVGVYQLSAIRAIKDIKSIFAQSGVNAEMRGNPFNSG
jgi:hypothetical protein